MRTGDSRSGRAAAVLGGITLGRAGTRVRSSGAGYPRESDFRSSGSTTCLEFEIAAPRNVQTFVCVNFGIPKRVGGVALDSAGKKYKANWVTNKAVRVNPPEERAKFVHVYGRMSACGQPLDLVLAPQLSNNSLQCRLQYFKRCVEWVNRTTGVALPLVGDDDPTAGEKILSFPPPLLSCAKRTAPVTTSINQIPIPFQIF